MKPYIAILIDSFWEAVGNKVLWALLIAWSLILMALAPFGYISERSFKLTSSDIDNRERLIEKLAKGAKGQGGPDIQAIAQRLDEEFLNRVRDAAASESPRRRLNDSELATGLNRAIAAQDLYSSEAFPSAERRKRLQPLIEQTAGELNADDLEELNRELMQLAFPLELHRPRAEQLYIGYAGFKISSPLRISRRQINQFLEPTILQLVIKVGLGMVAIFVALIVTSSIIPDTFRSGALHLLLSKPISRVWLFLSKFFGGCIFVLLNITYVLIGLYFIAGFRFDMWNSGLLGCIPLLMFVFIIFYSVSALVGLLWGNAIVCVISCIVFWLFCFAAGVTHESMRSPVELNQQIAKIQQVGEYTLAVNEQGDLDVWNPQYSVWQPAIEPESRGAQARTFGPIYDPERQLIITKSFIRTPFGLTARSRHLSVIRLDSQPDTTPSAADPASPQSLASPAEPDAEIAEATKVTSLSDARETPVWMADRGPELPQQLFDLVQLDDAIVAICRGGLYKLNMEKLDLVGGNQPGLFGLKLPWVTATAFEKISPAGFTLAENTTASATFDRQGLIIYSSGTLEVLRLDNDQLIVTHSVQLKEEESADGETSLPSAAASVPNSDGTEAALVQMNGRYCVVARDGMPLTILSSELEMISEIELPESAKARQLAWIPNTDQLAIITHTGELHQLDCASASVSRIETPYYGKCTSMNWQDESRVWLGVAPNRAVLMDIADNAVPADCIPRPTIFEQIFNYVVKPLYLVNPKPAALDNAMLYLLSGQQTLTAQLVTNDLQAAQIELEVWQPIFSNLAFVTVVLGIACIYVARKEY